MSTEIKKTSFPLKINRPKKRKCLSKTVNLISEKKRREKRNPSTDKSESYALNLNAHDLTFHNYYFQDVPSSEKPYPRHLITAI